MRYLSACSGIEAVSVAWQPLGWQAAMFAEVDPFCCWLLSSRYRASRPIFMPSRNSDTSSAPPNLLQSQMAVRRLTPRECERLQGFPDDYTLIDYRSKPTADDPRYKALGNSMVVPVMRWIGQRIATVDMVLHEPGIERLP
jgi:site-specific DNA-cytosine methylase